MSDTEETPEIPEPYWPATHSEPLPGDQDQENARAEADKK